ncbi:Nuclear pore complex protein Nup85 [Termitomyces sp. T112]|nr:Nuclear pore complex protein Nup85 [Termitomyces sp. T112]
MQTESNLNLLPPLVESGDVDGLASAGQVLSSTWSPLDASLAISVTSANPSGSRNGSSDKQPIYFASLDMAPSSERRLFITDTLVIFSAFQKVVETSKEHEHGWLLRDENVNIFRKLAIDYVNFIKECWIHASQPITHLDGPPQFSSDHYRSLYTCFSLFIVLYLAEPGYEDAPVGDDLMEWLNSNFIEPSTEEGDHLSSLDRSWEDENFWPYLTRATLRGLSKASLFFLGVLSQHPSEDLRSLTKLLAPLIESQPRLHHYSSERDFAYASRRWNDRVKALRIEMERVSEDKRFDGFDNWWDSLSDIVGILEGRAEVVMRVCKELGSDWKEICAAWGVFVNVRLRRQDLPDVVSQVFHELLPDPTSLEDMIHAALISGEPHKVLEHAYKLDRWLSAHLADFMVPFQLIEAESDESGTSLRDYYILEYAGYLHSDPALWRVMVDYMYSCGDVGKLQADEVLLRVPLRLGENGPHRETQSGDIAIILKDVSQTCLTYRRELVRRTVCKIAAQTMVSRKEYGLATAYSISAEDWPGLGRVVERVLEEYITNGASIFMNYASGIAPSVHELRNRPTNRSIFTYRLSFVVRYAHYHQLVERRELQDAAADLVAMFREDLTPKSWWAVLLSDSIPLLQEESALLFSPASASELLRRLEEIFVMTSQGAGEKYLSVLRRSLGAKGNSFQERDALEQLKIVRLALARYFGRCTPN